MKACGAGDTKALRGMLWVRQARCSSVPCTYLKTTMRAFCTSPGISYPDEHQALIPPPGDRTEVRRWMHGESMSEKLTGPVPDDRRVYCNRTIDLSKVEAVGFDMVSFSLYSNCMRVFQIGCAYARSLFTLSAPQAAMQRSGMRFVALRL